VAILSDRNSIEWNENSIVKVSFSDKGCHEGEGYQGFCDDSTRATLLKFATMIESKGCHKSLKIE